MEQEKFKAIINQHLDKMDGIKDTMKEGITAIFEKLDMKQLIKTPDSVIDILIQSIIVLIIKKHGKAIMKESKEYAKHVDDAA